MKPIAIVGGGWYGCHIAMALKARGIDFELFEARPRLFEGASGYNQNRLHLGFHYPRCAATRAQSKEGFALFQAAYPSLCEPILSNVYAVASEGSLIDFGTYFAILRGDGLAPELCSSGGLTNIQGAVSCNEQVIRTSAARDHFEWALKDHLRLGVAYEDISGPRPVINCTYQGWRPEFPGLKYEVCGTFVYETEERRAVTIMDGPFYSVYAYERNLSTLYAVRESRFAVCDSYEHAKARLPEAADEASAHVRLAESGVSAFMPWFRDRYKFACVHWSIRTIKPTAFDSRAASVRRYGNVIHVLPGKIDGIFYAEREVLKCLGYC